MAESQEFCLRWNDFHSSFHASLETLRGDESFTDVTLSCGGHLFRAHRVILSACSAHFKEILKEVPAQQHPVIVLPTVERDVMRAVLDFMYRGQVNVRQARLGAFLQVAETFAIQGLADEQTKRSQPGGRAPDRARPPDASGTPPSAKRRRSDRPPMSPAASGAGPPPQPPPPSQQQQQQHQPPSQHPRQHSQQHAPDNTVSLPDLAVKSEPDMLDELEEMLEPKSEQAGLDPLSDAHGLMSVAHEDSGGSQSNSDGGLAAAMVAAVVAQSPPGAGGRTPSGLPQRSLVREYFTGSGQDRLCRLCGHVLRLNRQLSTSGMWRHMRVKHPELVHTAEPAPCRAETAGPLWATAHTAEGSTGAAPLRIGGSTGVHETDWFFKS